VLFRIQGARTQKTEDSTAQPVVLNFVFSLKRQKEELLLKIFSMEKYTIHIKFFITNLVKL